MRLFHASFHEYSEGEVITATPLAARYQGVAELLDRNRPANAPLRSRSVFALNDAYYSAIYINAIENQDRPRFIYEVEMASPWRAPMAIVNQISKRGAHSQALSRLIQEYWSPQHEWNVFEFFSPAMVVKGIVDFPNLSTTIAYKMRFDYDGDVARAKRL